MKALVAAQKAMPELQRDKINPHFKSAYLSLEKLLAEVLPVLNTAGLAVTQWPTFVEADGVLHPALQTVLVHGESGEQISGTMLLLAGKQDPQGQGSAITYAKRYALMSLCGLSADEDDDGNKASATRRPKAAAKDPAAISSAQRTRLFAVAREKKLPTDKVREIIGRVAGVESSDDIPKAKYDAVIAEIEAAA
jgi:hypothetical protein